jgi:hypothetical protein
MKPNGQNLHIIELRHSSQNSHSKFKNTKSHKESESKACLAFCVFWNLSSFTTKMPHQPFCTILISNIKENLESNAPSPILDLGASTP